MPIPIPTAGPNPLYDYTVREIYQMYLNEGKQPVWAKGQAKIIYAEIHRMNIAEQRLWKKVRKHELHSEKLSMMND